MMNNKTVKVTISSEGVTDVAEGSATFATVLDSPESAKSIFVGTITAEQLPFMVASIVHLIHEELGSVEGEKCIEQGLLIARHAMQTTELDSTEKQ